MSITVIGSSMKLIELAVGRPRSKFLEQYAKDHRFVYEIYDSPPSVNNHWCYLLGLENYTMVVDSRITFIGPLNLSQRVLIDPQASYIIYNGAYAQYFKKFNSPKEVVSLGITSDNIISPNNFKL